MPRNWHSWKAADPQRKLQARIARRFRHHVRTDWNPKGRIRRESCQFCPDPLPAEAHHVNYDRPFAVVWVCADCHRSIERGELRVRPSDVWDYSSLISVRRRAWRSDVPQHEKAVQDSAAEVPF